MGSLRGDVIRRMTPLGTITPARATRRNAEARATRLVDVLRWSLLCCDGACCAASEPAHCDEARCAHVRYCLIFCFISCLIHRRAPTVLSHRSVEHPREPPSGLGALLTELCAAKPKRRYPCPYQLHEAHPGTPPTHAPPAPLPLRRKPRQNQECPAEPPQR